MKSVWHMIYLDIFEYLKNHIILNSSQELQGHFNQAREENKVYGSNYVELSCFVVFDWGYPLHLTVIFLLKHTCREKNVLAPATV